MTDRTLALLVCPKHDVVLTTTVEYATNTAYIEWGESTFQLEPPSLELCWDGREDYNWDGVVIDGQLVYECPDGYEWMREDQTDRVVLTLHEDADDDPETAFKHALNCDNEATCAEHVSLDVRVPWRPEPRRDSDGQLIQSPRFFVGPPPKDEAVTTGSILRHLERLPLSEAMRILAGVRDALMDTAEAEA